MRSSHTCCQPGLVQIHLFDITKLPDSIHLLASPRMSVKENLQPLAWGVTVPFIVITASSCLLRFYSRICVAKAFGLDDWFMVAASLRNSLAVIEYANKYQIVWCGQQYIAWMWLVLGGGLQVYQRRD